MISESLNWHQPTGLGDAQALLSRFPDAVLLAGGQYLIPRWEETQMPATVISLSQITALQSIEQNGNTLEIGAAVTLSELAGSEVVCRTLPALAGLAGKMGDRFMRNRATLGGALCTTQCAGCIPAAMLGTNATVHTTSRSIPSGEWFQRGGLLPRLEKGELIVRVSFQVPLVATHQFLRLIAAFRATAAESWLVRGDAADDVALNRLFSEHPARTDHHAGSAYREAQARRLLKKAAGVLRS